VPQAAPTASATGHHRAELRARGITHVLDALRDVPGAALVQNGSFGAATSLFLRGGENKYVQVLVDGVPVNDAGGSFNFANLTTDNVERIEVLRGPASVLYGSDAVTGVVQIFTNRGAPRTRGDLAARGGSFGTREYEGQGSGQARGIGWSAGAQRLGSDGILAFNNRYRNESGSGALRWARDGVGDAALAVRVQRAQYNFPTDGSGVPVDSNAFRREERATVSLDAGRFLRPGVELRTQLGLAGLRSRNDDRRDGPADTLGFSQGYLSADGTTRRHADVRANWYAAPRTVLTVGGDFRDVGYRMVDTTVRRQAATPGRPFSASRTTRAAYGQLLGDVGGLLTYTAGARYDDNSAFGAFRTARAGLGLNLPSRTTLRASAGNAFREPTMMENFSRAPVQRRQRGAAAGAHALGGGRRVAAAARRPRLARRDVVPPALPRHDPVRHGASHRVGRLGQLLQPRRRQRRRRGARGARRARRRLRRRRELDAGGHARRRLGRGERTGRALRGGWHAPAAPASARLVRGHTRRRRARLGEPAPQLHRAP
jgi:vitamin B12 transporter